MSWFYGLMRLKSGFDKKLNIRYLILMFRTLAECFVSSLEVYVRSLLLKNLMSNLLLKHVLASHSWILILVSSWSLPHLKRTLQLDSL